MTVIDTLFARLRAEGRKAFIPFLPAGDPDLDTTERAAAVLGGQGASLLEIGFPYSDPIADGPVIQAAYTRALARGIRIDAIWASVRRIADRLAAQQAAVPLVGMASYSLIHRRTLARFLDDAQTAGLSGVIVPDLPVEESQEVYDLATARQLSLIQLVTPTTPPERAARIAAASSGFLYCVSITGITGERDQLPPALVDHLQRLRQLTSLPLCVGFGISRPEHIRMIRDHADGVIVGSTLVRRLEEASRRPVDQVLAEVADLARSLVQALAPDAAPAGSVP